MIFDGGSQLPAGLASALVLILLLLLPLYSPSVAQDQPDGIFFGGTLGTGWAWIDHPEMDRRGRTGVVWDLHFGWQLSPNVLVGGQFSTWGTSLTGTPVHLHTIGLRLDINLTHPDRSGAVFISLAPGLALTEGDLEARSGVGAALSGGYRRNLGRWTTLGLNAGVHGHRYDNGNASIPYAVIELRFYGATY